MVKKRILCATTTPDNMAMKNNRNSMLKKNGKDKSPSAQSNPLQRICHTLFGGLNQKHEKILTRSLFGVILIVIIWIIFRVGIPAMILFFTFVVIQCYSEVISIGYRQYKDLSLPLFRFLQWFFLVVASFYVSGDIFVLIINNWLKNEDLLQLFTKYQKIISFTLYMTGIIIFVLNLQKRKYRIQFSIFAWYQLTLMILMVPLQLLLRTLFFGLIWVFLPMSLIIINDTFAYFFGIAFGKTPLIKLSPKKTWEGFIGGALSTMIGAIIVCNLMMQHQSFYCPIKYDTSSHEFVTECERSALFSSIPYPLPPFVTNLLHSFNSSNTITYMNYYPMYMHAIIMGLFASLISPFGGFFASGFKRAFKVKDFGDSIPGHGGMMDRMDCQVLMCIFVNVYIKTFISDPTPNNLMRLFMRLSLTNKYEFYHQLQNYFQTRQNGSL